jgi:hypothetical protein
MFFRVYIDIKNAVQNTRRRLPLRRLSGAQILRIGRSPWRSEGSYGCRHGGSRIT